MLLAASPPDSVTSSWQRGWDRTLLLRARLASGSVGWGIAESQPEVAAAIITAAPAASFDARAPIGGLAAVVTGRSAADRSALWRAMYDATSSYGRGGAAMQAMSAVDMACTDALARCLGTELAVLLGGRFRDRVQAYASAVLPARAADAAALADHVRARGFQALKLAWGAFDEAANVALAAVEAVRSRLPDGIALIFDLGYGSRRTRHETLRLAETLAEFEPLWLEEPCHPDDIGGLRQLVRRIDVPVAAGESCTTLAEFDALIDAGVEILQPDLARCGGFTQAVRVADRAVQRHRRVIPHAWQNDLLMAATASFCAVLPQEPWLEFSVAQGPLRDICGPRLPLTAGCIAVPDGPGIGVVPDATTIDRYRVTAS
ncbi:MAG: mandelate racemase/muconate lactonizing enzyme family protein [Solirubrobacteraceae bacterium]